MAFVASVFLVAVFLLQGTSTGLENGTSQQNEKEVIHLLTLLPYFNPIPALNPSWNGGDDIQPVLDLAKDQINNHSSILENYTLELVHSRAGCDVITETPLGFIRSVFTPAGTEFTGAIGPGCSTSTLLLATVTNRPDFSLVMLHGAGSSKLADRTQYPYLVGTLGSTEGFVIAYMNLIMKAKWNRLAIFYDNTRLYYTSTKRALLQLLEEHVPGVSVEILSPVSFTYLPLDEVRERVLRVILIMCPLDLTQRIVCLAKNNTMLYRDYQFVIMSHNAEDIIQPVSFSYQGVSYNCSNDQMASALERMLLLTQNLLPTEGEPLFSNITYSEYVDYYRNYRDIYNQNQQDNLALNSSFSVFATIYYDSVWAWALVLDNLTKSDPNFHPNGNYGDTDRANAIIQQFYSTSFQGASGLVRYRNDTGFTPRRIDISQVNGSMGYPIAFINISECLELVPNSSRDFIPDSFENVTLLVNQGGAIFFTIITVIELCVVVILHVITTVYYKRPSIKASSPKLLHLSYIGVYIFLLGTFLFSLYSAAQIEVEKKAAFCQLLWTWCLPIGFTLTFWPVAMRTWRIYRIFKHYLNPGPLISDPILIGTVAALLALDLVISVAWTVSAPFFVRPVVFVHRDESKDINVAGVRYDCDCNNFALWTGGILIFKLFVLFIFAAFAFLTRQISNNSFSTKSLRVMVYLLAIVLPLGFSIFYIIFGLDLDDRMSNFSFFTLCIEFCVVIALTVVCVFVPPVLPLFKTYQHKTHNHNHLVSSGTSQTKLV